MDKRSRILEAAERSFGLFGYKATTMEQVAKLADVGKGTIYTFFKNKEELLNEIMEKLIADMMRRAKAAIDEHDTFFNNLHRALYDILEFRTQHQLTFKLTQEVREFGTGTAQAALDQFEAALLAFLEAHIETAMDKGKIVRCDPKKTAFVLYRLYVLFVYEWETRYGERLSKDEIADLFDRYLVLGLEPR
ncbi:TetR/AcrR family transcriptional regulator [Camelliibacillus cellulosilyticus]|uniref:TetR/AcrR family transcriptional regulator n=1 Tax=Camelliibacillus cellulosilyticus TaxID=2174486 RepID=A0ABV9GK06_9BACL